MMSLQTSTYFKGENPFSSDHKKMFLTGRETLPYLKDTGLIFECVHAELKGN